MNLKSILLPVDFSHSSDAALGFASSLAADSNAKLTLLHVGEDTPAYLAGYGGFAYTPELQEKIASENRAMLDQIQPTVKGIRHEHQYLSGDPAQEILGFAERENVDLIVIGSHGRTGLSRLLLGSVAEAVVRGASCPVLTVKQPVAEEEAKKAETAEGSGSQEKDPPEPKSKFSMH